jgi:hypothetical protein
VGPESHWCNKQMLHRSIHGMQMLCRYEASFRSTAAHPHQQLQGQTVKELKRFNRHGAAESRDARHMQGSGWRPAPPPIMVSGAARLALEGKQRPWAPDHYLW